MASPTFDRRCIALAAACACAASQAAITPTGSYNTSTGVLLGPGNTVLPEVRAWIGGGGGIGGLTVDGGSFLQLAQLRFGSNEFGNGTGLVSGSGTRVELVGDHNGRLTVADWGVGRLTVAAGAVIDTSGNQAPCLVQFHYCDSFVGATAGDTARLTITDTGTSVRIGQTLFIGAPILQTQPVNGVRWGVPGGTTTATVEVLAGASLVVDRAQVGTRQWSSGNTGFERSSSQVTVAGAGSKWLFVGGQQWDPVTPAVVNTFGAGLSVANDRLAVANIDVRDGGLIQIDGPTGVANQYNFLNLANSGGRADMAVRGSGSAVVFTTEGSVLHVGRSLGSASLTLSEGARVENVWYSAVGRDGSFGQLALDGAGTRYMADGTVGAATAGSAQNAVFDIGNNGSGSVTLTNGARLEVNATQARVNGPQLSVGRGSASSGSLTIGSGAVVSLSAASVAPGTAGEAFNPWVRVGRDGNGTLDILGGGQLLMHGDALSTVDQSRGTGLYIGGTGPTTVGGRGVATVSGAGSRIAVTGSDAYLAVGIGPSAFGHLTVRDGAAIATSVFNVGRAGTGVLLLDGASIALSGQHSGSVQSGAALTIGGLGGIGVASMDNGATVSIVNLGSNGASLNLGGTTVNPLGDGSLTMAGGSSVTIRGAGTSAAVHVGRDGTGLLRMRGGSTLDVGAGQLFVGRVAGSDGTLIATDGSTITAGWVGVGRNRVAGVDSDGGTGTMVLNGATLNATDIVIGSNGFLGGSAGSINASGSIRNFGIFSPGMSPGVFSINGNFAAGAGSRLILEVQARAGGGFDTDLVQFGFGHSLDLAAMRVEFRFLGATDPNAFQAAGAFDIDTFLRQADGAGMLQGLGDAAYNGVSFSAQADGYLFTNFSFSAAGGAVFTAIPAPVPEPAAWLLMAAGLAAWPLLRRRRSGARPYKQ